MKEIKFTKLNLLIFLGVFFLGSLATIFVIRAYTFGLIRKLELEKAKATAEYIKVQALDDLAVKRFDKLQKEIELQIRAKLITEFILTDEEKRPFIYLALDPEGQLVRLYGALPPEKKLKEGISFDPKDYLFFFYSPLIIKDVTYGHLYLTFDLSRLRQLEGRTNFVLFLTYFIFFLIFFAVSSLINRRFHFEINRLIEFAKEFPRKKGETIALVTKFSETKDLALTLNWASLELKQAERDLIKEKRILEAIFATIEEAIFLLNEGFSLQMMNKLAKDLLSEIVNSTTTKEGKELLKGLFSEGKVLIYPELTVLTIDHLFEGLQESMGWEGKVKIGEKIYNLSFKKISIIEKEEFLLVLKDITEEVKAQEQFLYTEKIRTLVQLAAGVAHDLNNILAILFNHLNLLQLSNKVSEEVMERFKVMERSLVRAKYLSFQLLSLSKGGEIILESTNLEQVIKDVASFALAGTSVHFNLNVKVPVKNLECDPYALSQIFLNLMINSMQAQASLISIEIDKVTEGEKNFLKIIFSDDGPGIPPEILSKIFNPFFTTKKEGSGLGLFIVKTLVEKLGGQIEVESEIGKGTRFTISLPYKVWKGEDMEEVVKPLGRKLKILVVDDEDDLRESLAMILEELKHEVTTAENGEKALLTYLVESSKGEKFDLVITDFTMPGKLNGLDLIKTLKQYQADLQAILSTGYAEISEEVDWKSLGLISILRKPYTLNDLMSALSKVKI